MPSASHLTNSVRVVFASGIAELNQAMLERFTAIRPELNLLVVSEFQLPEGEWIPWHVQRPFDQNLTYVKAALGGRRIAAAAVAYDSRSALNDLRRAALDLSSDALTAYDEELNTAVPSELSSFLMRRKLRAITRQLRPGGRVNSWLRRIIHPSEAEIPIRARLAQARGLAAKRTRTTSAPAPLKNQTLQAGVSVVIPSRDGLELLREMLPPLLAQIHKGEIIVVDNGSTDGTADWLASKHPTIRCLSHEAPLSFARAVNKGIDTACYERVLLLNNDMIVEPRFVAELHAGFEKIPDLFCATAQILFPQGVRREETGKAMWRREHELDFPVRCDDPIPGEDLTWVLYGSGGCSMFETSRLRAIGCVSELYDPAYVEDMDFALRAWKRGWPSVYCDRAVVEHRHRSTTSRFYSERQIDFFVERNYLRFVASVIAEPGLFERLWLDGIRRLQLQAMAGRGAALDALRAIPDIDPAPIALTGHLSESEILALNNGDVAVFPGRHKEARTTVLIASPYLPFPLSHGGAVRIYNLMKQAAETHDLILMAFVDDLNAPPPELLAICSQIVLVRRRGTHYRRDTPRPDPVEEFDSASFRAALRQAVHQWKPAIVQLEFTWMAQYVVSCRPAKTILVEHDITFDLQTQLLDTSPSDSVDRLELKEQLRKWQTFETEAWRAVDCVVTMSAKDAATVVEARDVKCLPNGVDCERFLPGDTEPEPRRLLLIGSFAHLPNLLALEYFLRDAWPLLGPGYTLHVIGGARHEYYLDYFRDRVSLNLSQPGIEVEGFVADVRPAYHRAEIVLAPLTASAGTNIKVLEAMAMGKVVVSTSAGVNGLDVTAGHDFLLADSMAGQISTIADDVNNRKRIERNARETALRYDWRAIGRAQCDLYNRLTDAEIQ